ncbi:MAG: tRNA (guanine37-N1)-methyltransferase [Candidatus Nanohaloarchaea archaeon]
MNQEKIEEKAAGLFERQGFEVEKSSNRFSAVKDKNKLEFQVFSSEKYRIEDVEEKAEDVNTVFVDEELKDIDVEGKVSVLKDEENSKDYDLPSFELIGDIAVINDLDGREEKDVVEGIKENHPHIETMLLKEEQLSGEFRVGEYRKLYGESTETVHTEFGVDIKVDPTKTYYSERFSTERRRVAKQIGSGDKVLVMFAGVGPFALIAAKHSEAEKIVAVEKNPEACEYLKENIELNNYESRIEGYCGDVENILPELNKKFDHIVMPLPGKANEFLKIAEKAASENATIHYYRFMEEDREEQLRAEISDILDRGFSIKGIVECGEKSPSTKRVCVDIELE